MAANHNPRAKAFDDVYNPENDTSGSSGSWEARRVIIDAHRKHPSVIKPLID